MAVVVTAKKGRAGALNGGGVERQKVRQTAVVAEKTSEGAGNGRLSGSGRVGGRKENEEEA